MTTIITTQAEFEAMLWRHVERHLDWTPYGTLVDGNTIAIIEAPDAFDAALTEVIRRAAVHASVAEGRTTLRERARP